MKRTIGALLALLLCLGLSGCSQLSFVPSADSSDIEMPAVNEVVPPAPVGDSRADYSQRMALCYLSADGQQLSPISRTIKVSADQNLAKAALERLLEPSGAGDALSIAPEGTRLLSVEWSENLATVNLSIDARNVQYEQELLCTRAAIANTLAALPNIRYVNVLIGGQEESILGLPGGAMEKSDGNLTSLWAQRQSESERFLSETREAGESYSLERNVALYFASSDAEMLLPEVRLVHFSSEDYATTLIDELCRGPLSSTSARPVLPDRTTAETLLAAEPAIVSTEDGLRLIELSFQPGWMQKLEAAGMDPWRLYGALTLTLCRFVPEIDGISIDTDGKRVTRVMKGETELSFADGRLTPGHFAGAIGRVATIYLGAADGRLEAVKRVLEPGVADSARTLVEQLLLGPRENENALPVVPEGVVSADILGLRVEGSVARVNLSSNFYRLCQSLNAREERTLIYAFVNTLTELNGVKRVRFYVESETVEALGNVIYLKGSLMRNPGLIAPSFTP